MSLFTTKQPVGCFNDATGLWVLDEPWICTTRAGVLSLRPGFESDGASIPRLLWPFVGPRYAQSTMPAALCHDALYAAELCARPLADLTFFDLLRERGLTRAKAGVMTGAVRICGGVVWTRHTKDTIREARRFASLHALYASADEWARGTP